MVVVGSVREKNGKVAVEVEVERVIFHLPTARPTLLLTALSGPRVPFLFKEAGGENKPLVLASSLRKRASAQQGARSRGRENGSDIVDQVDGDDDDATCLVSSSSSSPVPSSSQGCDEASSAAAVLELTQVCLLLRVEMSILFRSRARERSEKKKERA